VLKQIFAQRIRRLREYALSNLPKGVVRDKVISLCNNSSLFQKFYDHPNAHRTSNMVDRLMRQQNFFKNPIIYNDIKHKLFIRIILSTESVRISKNLDP
jgi:hypothetical protein